MPMVTEVALILPINAMDEAEPPDQFSTVDRKAGRLQWSLRSFCSCDGYPDGIAAALLATAIPNCMHAIA